MSLASYHCSTPGSGLFQIVDCRFRKPSLHLCKSAICNRKSEILLRCFSLAATVSAEHAGRRELTELVADHVLRDEALDELAAIVDQERVADELGHHGAVARPGFDRLAVPGVLAFHLCQQPRGHVRPFFQRTTPGFSPAP